MFAGVYTQFYHYLFVVSKISLEINYSTEQDIKRLAKPCTCISFLVDF